MQNFIAKSVISISNVIQSKPHVESKRHKSRLEWSKPKAPPTRNPSLLPQPVPVDIPYFGPPPTKIPPRPSSWDLPLNLNNLPPLKRRKSGTNQELYPKAKPLLRPAPPPDCEPDEPALPPIKFVAESKDQDDTRIDHQVQKVQAEITTQFSSNLQPAPHPFPPAPPISIPTQPQRIHHELPQQRPPLPLPPRQKQPSSRAPSCLSRVSEPLSPTSVAQDNFTGIRRRNVFGHTASASSESVQPHAMFTLGM